MNLRHYEIVFLIHPNASDRAPDLISNYEKIIKDGGGIIHRLEDWGDRQLAYPIEKINRAHYVLLNIECSMEVLAKLENDFRFNENIIRNVVLKREKAITEPSPIKLEKTNKSKAASDVKLEDIEIPEDLEETGEA